MTSEVPEVGYRQGGMPVRVPARRRGSRLSALVRAPFTRRAWSELLYVMAGLPIGVVGFVLVVTTSSLGAGLLVTFVGLPLLALAGLMARALGQGVRKLANVLIGAAVPPPPPFRSNPGLLGWIGSGLRDGTAWRARLYLLAKFPLGVASFVCAVAVWTYGLGGLTYPIWKPFLSCDFDSFGHGACHRAVALGGNVYLDQWWRVVLTAIAGALLVLVAPWVVRGAATLDRFLVRFLLGPTRSSARMEELRRTRASAVEDSAALLRRIERERHDGTQARLVSIAMKIGLAKEKLDEGGDGEEARALLATAHAAAKGAIVELRDLVRGIHPPVLDAGLDAALATLASHSPVPVRLRSAMTERPSPAVETIAYFCAAELLTNVARHSGATQAMVAARTEGETLRIEVWDDGCGGARVGAGSGLSGLHERARTVDGRLVVDSPAGGPTVAVVELPLRS